MGELIGPALGAVGALTGAAANDSAMREAKRARRAQDRLTGRQVELFDTILSAVKGADQQGAFDPDRRLERLDEDTARYESRDRGNLAGAMRVAGYQPGDSEIGVRQDTLGLKYRENRERMADDIRTDSIFRKLQAYSMANPGMLNPAIATQGARESNSMAGLQNPAGFFSALMPFLTERPKAVQTSGSAFRLPAPTAMTFDDFRSGGYKLPVKF